MDETFPQTLLSVLLRSRVLNTKSRIPIGSWRFSGGHEVESADRAEDKSGSAGERNFQLPEDRSTKSEDQANNQGTSSSGEVQADDAATEDRFVPAVRERVQRR